MIRRPLPYLVAVVALCCLASQALADGMLIPPLRPDVPYFTIKYHHVKVEIDEQIATTHVDQVFVNETDREQEATYLFPLPPGAVVKGFTLIADGQKMEGEILPRDKATSIYEDIVRKRRDPALLEYSGRDMYKARIFPIPAHGERRIELYYTQVLGYDNGLVSYNYPMSTEKFSKSPITETVFEATIKSKAKLGTIYSPSHDLDISRRGGAAVASYEEKNSKPDRDLLLYYTVAKEEVGTSLLTFKEKGEDGFFLLLAAPAEEDVSASKAAAKNVVFVLDRSGSMSGEKIEQVRRALEFCVNSLNPQDQFEIISFATSVTQFGDGLKPATRENIEKARSFIKNLRASGGTDIDGALKAALECRKTGQPNYIAFLTDGLPTAGEVTDPDKIAPRVKQAAAALKSTPTRLFAFGAGYDVDTHFLDRLAEENGGLPTYVRPGEDIEVKVSNWYGKIAQPVLTEVQVDYGSVKTYDAYPRDLPDLFGGSQLAVFGRYKQDTAGKTKVTISGDSGHGKRSYVTEVDFPEVNEGAEYLASLWAGRKIGYLLDQIRLNGSNKELVNEIVELSTKYGILTEYTAFLANEDTTAPRAAAPAKAMDAMAGAFSQRGGGWATSQTQNTQVMRQAMNVASQNRYLDAEGREVQVANVQNRGQRAFVARNGQWQDMRYDPASRKVDLQVQAYSEAHFQLSRNFPTLNQSLAVSDNMIVVVNGKSVQIGPEGKTKLTDEELKALGASVTTTGSTGTKLEAPRMADGGRGLLAGGLAMMLAMLALPRRRRG
jgi:Ca-activated chloride channel family protein